MNDKVDMVQRLNDEYLRWGESRGETVQSWLALLDDNVKWSSLAGGSRGMEFTRDASSKAEVARYFEELANDWEMLYFTVEEIISQGDRIVVRSRCGWKSKQTGKTAETPKVDFIRVKNGKITEFMEFYDTAVAFAAARPD